MQEDDAVVAQMAHGVLDVAHYLLVGVQAVDQGYVDGMLFKKGRLVLEEGVAGRLEVTGDPSLCVGEFPSALGKFERRVDGDLHIGADPLERLPSRNTDLQIDGFHSPFERPLHGPDPVHARQRVRQHHQPVVDVHATILSIKGGSDEQYAGTPGYASSRFRLPPARRAQILRGSAKSSPSTQNSA